MFEIHSTLTTPTQVQLIKYTLVSIDAFLNAWMLIYDAYSDGISVHFFWYWYWCFCFVYIRCVRKEMKKISNTKIYLNLLFNIRWVSRYFTRWKGRRTCQTDRMYGTLNSWHHSNILMLNSTSHFWIWLLFIRSFFINFLLKGLLNR